MPPSMAAQVTLWQTCCRHRSEDGQSVAAQHTPGKHCGSGCPQHAPTGTAPPSLATPPTSASTTEESACCSSTAPPSTWIREESMRATVASDVRSPDVEPLGAVTTTGPLSSAAPPEPRP